jgi:hypothetical protein
MPPARNGDRPYVVITADSHAGASLQTYREYLDADHKVLFDEWRGAYRPQQRHIGSKKHKNWTTPSAFATWRAKASSAR